MEPVEVRLQVLLRCCAVNPGLVEAMTQAESETSEIDFELLGDPAKQYARTLSYMLSQVLTGGPLRIAMNAQQNGMEAWRVLVRQEEPASGASQVSALTALLGTKFSGKVETLQEELRSLAGAIQRYEGQLAERIPDSLYQALLKGDTPGAIRSQVDLTTFVNAAALSDALICYATVHTSSMQRDASTPTPMDV